MLDGAIEDKPGSDRHWRERIRASDAAALEELFALYGRPLVSFAYRYVESADLALSIVEGVFVRLWRGRHSLAFRGSVRGYFYAAAHRSALDTLGRLHAESRWRAGLPPRSESVAIDGSGGMGGVLRAAIARLPAHSRAIAFMRWSDRLTHEEISTVLGCNVRFVGTQLEPATRTMRAMLGGAAAAGTGANPIELSRLEAFLAGELGADERDKLSADLLAMGADAGMLDLAAFAWQDQGPGLGSDFAVERAWRVLARRLMLSVPDDIGAVDRALQPRLAALQSWTTESVAIATRISGEFVAVVSFGGRAPALFRNIARRATPVASTVSRFTARAVERGRGVIRKAISGATGGIDFRL